jgi:predicted O-methyltransferase YrrM
VTPPTLLDRIPPDSVAADTARRAVMAARAAGLARSPDESSRAVGRVLATTAFDRIPPEERAWLARIDGRRPVVTELALEIADICALWSVPKIWGRLQLRMVRELAPRSCLELGTAFGMSAAYQAAALELEGVGRLVTLDAEPRVVPIARETFEELGLDSRVEQRVGAIEEVLEDLASEVAPIDYGFMDAEHTERATVDAFETMLPHLAPGAVVVVDDIAINEEMRRAWEAIRAGDRVARAVDLRRQGIVVIGPGGAGR